MPHSFRAWESTQMKRCSVEKYESETDSSISYESAIIEKVPAPPWGIDPAISHLLRGQRCASKCVLLELSATNLIFITTLYTSGSRLDCEFRGLDSARNKQGVPPRFLRHESSWKIPRCSKRNAEVSVHLLLEKSFLTSDPDSLLGFSEIE